LGEFPRAELVLQTTGGSHIAGGGREKAKLTVETWGQLQARGENRVQLLTSKNVAQRMY